MTVGELIELLEQHPKDIEVLIDCRNIDDAYTEQSKDFYEDEKELVILYT